MEQLTLLFVDLLGTKARWHSSGRAGAERVFRGLEYLIRRTLATAAPGGIVNAFVETDSAAIVCRTPSAAISVGRYLYRSAFMAAQKATQPRQWLRGVITRVESSDLRVIVSDPAIPLDVARLSAGLLDAISVERSGVRGMRLLVAADSVSRAVTREFRLNLGRRGFIPFSHLKASSYYGPDADSLKDFLWMATDHESQWASFVRMMEDRLRWSATSAEELAQAAATQVVFNECIAEIIARDRYSRTRTAGRGIVFAE